MVSFIEFDGYLDSVVELNFIVRCPVIVEGLFIREREEKC